MSENFPIYLDYNATTPLHPEVSKVMAATLGTNFFDGNFGNASSAHFYGNHAHEVIEDSRNNLAKLLGCKSSELIFTSCGSESNNIAIFGACHKFKTMFPSKTCEIIISCVDHPSVKETCKFASELYDAKIVEIPVNAQGQIDPHFVLEKVNENTCLVSIMFANNEIGTLLNVPEVFNLIENQRKQLNSEFPLLHTDCAQAIGKVPVKVNFLHCDLLSVAAHKFYGPKGVGALFIRKDVQIPRTILHGAGQERGLRPGTENITGIAGLGKAAEIANNEIIERLEMQSDFVLSLFNIIKERINNKVPIKVNGMLNEHLFNCTFKQVINELINSEKNYENSNNNENIENLKNCLMKLGCLPGTLSISFKGLEAMDVVSRLSDKVCTSVGSACHSKCRQMSSILAAVGLDECFAFGTFRISVGCGLTKETVIRAANLLADDILSHLPQQ
ncbi:Cysteine desulfurase [Tritrichomonas foetus]|uniref:cysteine desulfurase n=1 Tax=Tritrichomonas foetus TaxID=1144522 RepID=A0A1J4J7U4_9EUKA|nr:Cysteine desulfurase [Tritrichomonas foetus]|eukprot:OHS94303.1 Cysteine desulfurase [Tritrichomonas foetus]